MVESGEYLKRDNGLHWQWRRMYGHKQLLEASLYKAVTLKTSMMPEMMRLLPLAVTQFSMNQLNL